MKVLFCGGGTLGPVTPLLAVLRRMREMDPKVTFVWAGTSSGPEAALVEAEGVPFHSIPVAKAPRYLSTAWLRLPYDYLTARRMARQIIAHERPDLVVTAGGYTGVPVIREAARQGIPCALHQLDLEPGLSNKAVAKSCASVTTSFRYDDPPFGRSVASMQIETPCRFSEAFLPSVEDAKRIFGIDPSRKAVFVMGGGTGALAINEALAGILDEVLLHADVIHSTGVGKTTQNVEREGYHPFELLNEAQVKSAYAAVDIVVSRAGIGSLSELAALKKAAIVIPIPASHQEANACAVGQGIVWLHQTEDMSDALRTSILETLKDEHRRIELGNELHRLLPTDDGSALAKKWVELV